MNLGQYSRSFNTVQSDQLEDIVRSVLIRKISESILYKDHLKLVPFWSILNHKVKQAGSFQRNFGNDQPMTFARKICYSRRICNQTVV